MSEISATPSYICTFLPIYRRTKLSWILNNKNQLDAAYYFIVLLIGSTCFGRRCCLQAASSVLYTTSCKHSLVLLRMGEIIARNMLSWLKLVKSKGNSISLQAWSGPEGSRKLSFPDFVTTAQDGGTVVSLTHRPPLPPGNTPGTHFC